MVTLNFASGLLNILPGRGLINEVDPAKPFSRHRLSGQIKHQEHRYGAVDWKAQMVVQ